MAASNCLDWRKNLSPLGIPPFIKQDLGSVLKPGEYRIGADFSVGQGDLTRESWRISSQINAAPAEKGALRRRFDGFKTDSRGLDGGAAAGAGCAGSSLWRNTAYAIG